MDCRRFKPEIFFSVPVSGLVICLVLTSLITEFWVTGTAKIESDPEAAIEFNYGLFRGHKSYSRVSESYSLRRVCEGDRCMFSCAGDSRGEDLEDILSDCPLKNNYGDRILCRPEGREAVGSREGKMLSSFSPREGCNVTDDERYDSATRDESSMMMGYGTWVSTVVFLVFGLAFSVVAVIFAVLNSFSNPIETIVGPYGLVIWNSIATLCYLLVVCIWAGEYHTNLSGHAPISNVLRQGQDEWTSDGGSGLGYSYWLVLVCFFLHLLCVGMVGYYIYSKYKPKRKVVDVGYEDGPKDVILY